MNPEQIREQAAQDQRRELLRQQLIGLAESCLPLLPTLIRVNEKRRVDNDVEARTLWAAATFAQFALGYTILSGAADTIDLLREMRDGHGGEPTGAG